MITLHLQRLGKVLINFKMKEHVKRSRFVYYRIVIATKRGLKRLKPFSEISTMDIMLMWLTVLLLGKWFIKTSSFSL